jgi:hypothetical protein
MPAYKVVGHSVYDERGWWLVVGGDGTVIGSLLSWRGRQAV